MKPEVRSQESEVRSQERVFILSSVFCLLSSGQDQEGVS